MSLKVVTAIQARKIFGTIMNAVSFGNDQYIVERKEMPMVAIVSVKRLEQMDRARQRFFRNMSEASDCLTGEDPKELDSILTE